MVCATKKLVPHKFFYLPETNLIAMDDHTRMWLFWLACLPTRACVAAAAAYLSYRARGGNVLVGTYAAITALGLTVVAIMRLFGGRQRGGFGGVVWWDKQRLVHIATYTACALLTLNGVREGALFLSVDVLLAALFGAHRYLLTQA